MSRTARQIAAHIAEIARTDEAQAREAGLMAVAMRAPYSYATLAAANRAGRLVDLLGGLDSYTLRAQAVRFAVEAPGAVDADEVERRFARLLSEARFGRAA
jgi:hypothetical protein